MSKKRKGKGPQKAAQKAEAKGPQRSEAAQESAIEVSPKATATAKGKPIARQSSRSDFAPIWWVAVVLALVALVFSSMPGTSVPQWLMQLGVLTSDRTLDLDLDPAYGPLGYADLVSQLTGATGQDAFLWILGAAEAVWVVALTLIVLSACNAYLGKPFDAGQTARFFTWGCAALVIACVLTVVFAALSGSLLQAGFANASQKLSGYVAYVGGTEAMAEGFGLLPWLWVSLALAAVAFCLSLIPGSHRPVVRKQ